MILNSSLRVAIGFRFVWKVILLVVILLLAVLYYRPFCKYLCPLGALYGICNPIASYCLVIDRDKCISCGKCQSVCGMDIKTCETPNSPDCIQCGSCIEACPVGAIDSTWKRFGQKYKERFVINDNQYLSDAQNLNMVQGRAAFLGALMIVGAMSCGILGIIELHTIFLEHEVIDFYQKKIHCTYPCRFCGLFPAFWF